MTKALQQNCLKALSRIPTAGDMYSVTAQVLWRDYLSLAVFAEVNATRRLVPMTQIRRLVDRYCTSLGIPEPRKNPEYDRAGFAIKWTWPPNMGSTILPIP